MKKELKNLINMRYTNITNRMHKIGKYDLPQQLCPKVDIDFIALYSETGLYCKTEKTAIAFFQYDAIFDGPYGLWNAIYYDNARFLNKFKERFKNVKVMVSPDYSHTEDMEKFENYYRYAKSRIVSGWLTLELGILVIPLITYACREDFELMITGLDEVEAVCISTKGVMGDSESMQILKEAIEYTIDHLRRLKTIIVYSVSKEENIERLFEKARKNNIEVVVPQNTLRERNLNKEVRHGKV